MPRNTLFHNPVLRAILLSALLLQIGISIRSYAILLFVMDQTDGDPTAVSMIFVSQFAPVFIFSLIGGTLADRWRPRRTIISCDLLSSLSVFIVLLTLIFGTWKAVFFATFASAIMAQFSQPAVFKLIKLHAFEDQIQSMSMANQTLISIFAVIGPILGIFVYQTSGIYIAIGITCLAFLLSAGVLTFLPPDRMPTMKEQQKRNLGKDMLVGLRYVASSKELSILSTCFIFCGLGLGLIQPLGIFLVTERLALPQEYFQWLAATNGAGMIIGGMVMLATRNRIAPLKLLLTGIGIAGLSIAVAGYSTNLALTITAQFFGGLVYPFTQAAITTLMLQNTEESFVGRMNGLRVLLLTGSMVIGMGVSGWLKSLFSIVAIYQIAAMLFILGLIVSLRLLPFHQTKSIIKSIDS